MTWKRVATAAVLIPIVVALVLFAPPSVVAIALALVTLLALFEFFALGDAIGHRAYRFWTGTCTLALIFVQWIAAIAPFREVSAGMIVQSSQIRIFGIEPTIADILFLYLLGIAALSLWTRRPLVEALPAAGMSSAGLLLVAFPLSFAIRLDGIPSLGPLLLLFSLVIIWVGDTAAYFVGRTIGSHLLAPDLSPKKTWEGTVASFVGSLAVAVLFSRWITLPLPLLLGMAAAGNIAGQVGDLFESAFKRSAGVKDSGSLLPGHGGILDRIDALVLAIPVVWYYWIWVCSPRA
jgi:phosphatidate cytidylyltransferase